MQLLPVINQEKETKRIVSFLKKILREQGFQKVVVGISGGIDSTTCLYLLKEALPPENIFVARLDYWARSDRILPKQNIYKVSIKSIVDEFIKVAGVEGKGISAARSRGVLFEASTDGRKPETGPATAQKIRLGNIMARVRMIILYDLAKKHHALVCGTENKTEHLLGYFTRFGDEASDIEPIRHLYKTQVYQLAKYLKVPDKIINQRPTAGLWSGQTDEAEFGFTYEEADQVLYLYFEKKMTLPQIKKKGFKNTQKIIDRVKQNEYKHLVPYTL